jgi:hypothetical protein
LCQYGMPLLLQIKQHVASNKQQVDRC